MEADDDDDDENGGEIESGSDSRVGAGGSASSASEEERVVEKGIERCEGFGVERRVRVSLRESEAMEDDAIGNGGSVSVYFGGFFA